ncbi:MAG: hypothetical protein IJ087_09975 [Eggerthellaceae bacterium]|nr:hypothetical protein [Eggerthellaceae bacterium]
MTYDSFKDMAYDVSLDNQELRAEVKRLKGELNDAKRACYDMKMNLMFANDKLRKSNLVTDPYEVDEGEYECGECNAELKRHWWACPGCGKRIDWDAVHLSGDSDWYAEEGERFLQEAVYDPIREAMRS